MQKKALATQQVKDITNALTYQPRTKRGKAVMSDIGEALAPAAGELKEFEKTLGDYTFRNTGSPALAAAAATMPTALMEAIGFKGSKTVTGAPKLPTKGQVKRAIMESAPEVEQLKKTARGVYKEIDESGVTIQSSSVDKLINSIEAKTRKSGLDPRVTQKAAGALEVLKESKGLDQAIGEIDTLRNVAQNVAGSIDNTEKALGNIMISEIDSFLDALKTSDLTKGAASTGRKYKAARKLWGRARRAELIQDAIKAGEGRASGAENGIRIELDKITRNKKLSKYFTESEKALIKDVVKGDFTQNMAKLVGRFGFSEGRATNVLSAMSGVGAGGILGGGVGAFAVPAVGTASRQIAQKLTRNKAKFTQQMVKAGDDANEIVKAYLTAVPKAKRSSSDLADLLADPNIDLTSLKMIANETFKDAVDIAKGKRAINMGVAAVAGAATEAVENINQQSQ